MIELRLSYEEIIFTWNGPNCWDAPIGKWETKQDVHLDSTRAATDAQLSKACWGIVGWLIQTSNEHTKEDGELSILTRDILHIVAEQIGIWLHSQGIEEYE